MKKEIPWPIIGALLCTAAISVWGHAETSPRETVITTLKNYSPTGYHIITEYSNAPLRINMGVSSMMMSKTDFMIYVRGSGLLDIASSLNAVVHETCHGYSGRMAYHLAGDMNITIYPGDRYLAFYIGGNDNLLVRITRVFPSSEMAHTFSRAIQTFRFPTYVNSDRNNMGTQIHGIYGLLDEMNAYYHGTKTAFDLLPFYQAQPRQDFRLWKDFFNQVNGTYYAHLEFKLFIVKYLAYAEEKYPDIYRDILNNAGFKKAFAAIDNNFTALNEEYFRSKDGIFRFMKERGIDAREEGKYLYLKSGNASMGLGNFSDTYNLLSQELGKSEYREILARMAAQ